MNHLTFDEIIEFVSLKELNEAAIELSATVNGHICKCEECRRLVSACQTIYDEFEELAVNRDFGKYAMNMLSNEAFRYEYTKEPDFDLGKLD